MLGSSAPTEAGGAPPDGADMPIFVAPVPEARLFRAPVGDDVSSLADESTVEV